MDRKEKHNLYMREWRKIPKNRLYNRDYQRKRRHSKIYKSFEWTVSGLILVRKSDKTISVEPLSIRSNVSQKIIELSGLD